MMIIIKMNEESDKIMKEHVVEQNVVKKITK